MWVDPRCPGARHVELELTGAVAVQIAAGRPDPISFSRRDETRALVRCIPRAPSTPEGRQRKGNHASNTDQEATANADVVRRRLDGRHDHHGQRRARANPGRGAGLCRLARELLRAHLCARTSMPRADPASVLRRWGPTRALFLGERFFSGALIRTRRAGRLVGPSCAVEEGSTPSRSTAQRPAIRWRERDGSS